VALGIRARAAPGARGADRDHPGHRDAAK
jgi:hypothetical protein